MTERARPEADYENLPAQEYFQARDLDPNEHREPPVLWDDVQDCLASVETFFVQEGVEEDLRNSILDLHNALRIYTLRQFVNPTRAILEKYPGCCPYCGYRECHCSEIKQGTMQRNPHPPARELIPFKLYPEMAQRLLERIYNRANESANLRALWERVQKEAKEIEELIQVWEEAGGRFTPDEARHFTFELADIFARLYAVMSRLGIDIGTVLSNVRGGPPYQGTSRPTIVPASLYTDVQQL